MKINPHLTIGEVQDLLTKAGKKIHLNWEHGVYHAYVHDETHPVSYARGDLVEAISGVTIEAEA